MPVLSQEENERLERRYRLDEAVNSFAGEPGLVTWVRMGVRLRLPLLDTDERRAVLTRVIDRGLRRWRATLIAFVFLPARVDLLAAHPAGTDVGAMVKGLKWASAKALRPVLMRDEPNVGLPRQGERRWVVEVEGGEDPNLRSQTRSGSALRGGGGIEGERLGGWYFWRSTESVGEGLEPIEPGRLGWAIGSVHYQPVLYGLCEDSTDWAWSSVQYYLDEDKERDARMPVVYPVRTDPAKW